MDFLALFWLGHTEKNKPAYCRKNKRSIIKKNIKILVNETDESIFQYRNVDKNRSQMFLDY